MPTSSLVTTVAGPVNGADLDQLQGAWRAVAGRRAATLRFDGARFTFAFHDGDRYAGTVRLAADADPKQMDLRIEDGPAGARGLSAYCIYHVEGDTLRWCPTVPGAGYRLTRFPSVEDDRYFCLVFHRDRAHRPH